MKLNKFNQSITLYESYQEFILNERIHIIKNMRDMIDDIAEIIYNDFKNNHTIKRYSGWAYIPSFNICLKALEKDVETIGYPIYLDYEFAPLHNVFMQIEDRADYFDTIHITINVYLVREFNNKYLSLEFIKKKLKHEFTHVREIYSLVDKNISANKKFTSSDIDNDLNLDENILLIIKKYMYWFSQTEFDARNNETIESIDNMFNDELEYETKNYKSFNDKIMHLILLTDDSNLFIFLLKLCDDIKDAFINKLFFIILLIAYYFKKNNIYKSVNSKFLTDEYIENTVDEISLQKDARISRDFSNWLQTKITDEYHKVMISIYDNIKERIS